MTEARRERVQHLTATLSMGGTEVSCLSLVRALSRRNIESWVSAVQPGSGAIADQLRRFAGRVDVLPAGRFRRMISFYRLCRKDRPDACVFHFFTIDHVLLALAAKLAGCRRLVVKLGNPAPANTNRTHLRKLALVLFGTRVLAMKFVCSSAYIRNSMERIGKLPRDTLVIHNGCAVTEINERSKAARRDADAAIANVTMVARLDPIKDHDTLLRAFAQLPEKIGERAVHLRIVGNGPLEDALRKQAAELGIASRVAFLGERSDVPELLGTSDAFVLSTTREEGFGVVLAEALAAEVPCIASDVPACREVLRDGALGTLVPTGDSGALAEAIERSISDRPVTPDVYTIDALYGADTMADRYLPLLADLP